MDVNDQNGEIRSGVSCSENNIEVCSLLFVDKAMNASIDFFKFKTKGTATYLLCFNLCRWTSMTKMGILGRVYRPRKTTVKYVHYYSLIKQ